MYSHGNIREIRTRNIFTGIYSQGNKVVKVISTKNIYTGLHSQWNTDKKVILSSENMYTSIFSKFALHVARKNLPFASESIRIQKCFHFR